MEAVEWMEVQAIKSGRRAKDLKLVEELFQKRLERARAFEAAQKVYEAYAAYAALSSDFKSLRDVTEFEKKAARLRDSKEVKEYLKEEERQLARQRELSRGLISLRETMQDSAARDAAFQELRKRIAELRTTARAAADSGERRIARRTLSSVFANVYEAAMFRYPDNYELLTINLEFAAELSPDNAGVLYELARAYALRGDRKRALETLSRALEKGFKDAARVENEKAFNALREEGEYLKIIEALKKAR